MPRVSVADFFESHPFNALYPTPGQLRQQSTEEAFAQTYTIPSLVRSGLSQAQANAIVGVDLYDSRRGQARLIAQAVDLALDGPLPEVEFVKENLAWPYGEFDAHSVVIAVQKKGKKK
jgi:hypothetical protein